MKLSEHGIQLLKNFEGLSTKAYKATPKERYYTIGYGHYGPDVQKQQLVTMAEAENLLRFDVSRFERDVVAALNADEIQVTQGQFDALVCFAFNCGLTALINSSLWKKLRAGDIQGAANQFLCWNKADGKVLEGLTRRREAQEQQNGITALR